MNRLLVPFNVVLVASILVTPSLAGQVVADTARLPELVVTASKVAPPENTLPVAATVIRGDDLRARGIIFVADALREVPGVMLVQTGSYGAPLSIFRRGGESNFVKVLLDGVPLTLPGGSINLANLTTADLDRIEIVRGPASVLYGADAMSGVIQLFTRARHPGGRTHGDAHRKRRDVRHDSDRGAHRRAVPVMTWSVSANGSHFNTPMYVRFQQRVQQQQWARRGSAGTAAAKGRAALVARYGDTRSFSHRWRRPIVDHNQLTTEKSLALGLDASRFLGKGVMGNVQGFASRLDQGSLNLPDSPADTVGFGFDGNSSIVTWRRGVDARLDWRKTPHTVWSIGAGVEHETDDEASRTVSNFGSGAEVDTGTFSANRTTRNLYAQLLADPTSAASIQAGARLDDNSAFGTFGTWRAGASFHLTSGMRLWGAVGTAFKAPTFSQLFANTAFEVGNKDRSSRSGVRIARSASKRDRRPATPHSV